MTAHGLPDPAHGVGGSINAQWLDDINIGPMLRAPDGKLLVIGTAGAHNDQLPQRVVARLNPDGTFDGTYGAYGVARPPLQIAATGRPWCWATGRWCSRRRRPSVGRNAWSSRS